ncbi:MAG: hypothetical protein IPK82_44535 [Polyangiaceae bacterium]|nr:hypothetical protein [Polyangiaceae bacterium]
MAFEPEVKGRVEWVNAHTLEFVADKPFPVGQKYTVTLGDVQSEAGHPLSAEWKVTAIVRGVVAGKVLSHTPKPGKPRVIVMHPSDYTVKPDTELSILYDQPVDLAAIKEQVILQPEGGSQLPVTLSHPALSLYQGVSVDRRFVVHVRPRSALEAGQKYTLRYVGDMETKTGEAVNFNVASALAVRGLECPSHLDDACSSSAMRLETSGNEVVFLLNNPLHMKAAELRRAVQIVPAVKRFDVRTSGWDDGRLVVNAAFEPSVQYTVTLSGLVDRFGSRLTSPVRATVERSPLQAGAVIGAGVVLLNDERSRAFEVYTTNVTKAELRFWKVGPEKLSSAASEVRVGNRPSEPPTTTLQVIVTGVENQPTVTRVDLTPVLATGEPVIAAVDIVESGYGADMPAKDSPSPLALLIPNSADHLGVHTEVGEVRTVVHVAQLATGDPRAGATVTAMDDKGTTLGQVKTGADGMAILPPHLTGWLTVADGAAKTFLPLNTPETSVAKLFPAVSAESEMSDGGERALVFTDRGVVRPGSSVKIYATVRLDRGAGLAPLAAENLTIRALGPTGDEVFRAPVTSNEFGSVSAEFQVPARAKLGRHRLLVERGTTIVAESILQVAEVEIPRFAVDVKGYTKTGQVGAAIATRYLFGAPMSGAKVTWTARREPAAFAEGPFAGLGLTFREQRHEWDPDNSTPAWSRAGEGKADAEGLFRVQDSLPLTGTSGPQRFVYEANVSDDSHRSVAGKGSVVVHPSERYAGLRIRDRWVAPGESFGVDLGVVDRNGNAVLGANVNAVVHRVDYTQSVRRMANGSVDHSWTRRLSKVSACKAVSGPDLAKCTLTLPNAGDYQISAELDGKTFGSLPIWAYQRGLQGPQIPDRGRALSMVLDKAHYEPGDVAHIFLTSPFETATAIVQTQNAAQPPKVTTIEGGAGVIEIPLSAADMPHLNVSVSLLPKQSITNAGAASSPENVVADYRVGAVRIPVSSGSARLDVIAEPQKKDYRPGDRVVVDLTVNQQGQPVTNAELAIAVVDEGMLRLTGYHAPDPVEEFYPGEGLQLDIFDTRASLADRILQSHVAGDGDGGTPGTKAGRRGRTQETMRTARRETTDTTFWDPHVRTNAEGKATIEFTVPDNLTEYRVMAVAVDSKGKGGTVETGFRVNKPVLLAPALPRFVMMGDTFEAAALLHNTTDDPSLVKVLFADRVKRLLIPAHGHVRVEFDVVVACEAPRSPAPDEESDEPEISLNDDDEDVDSEAVELCPVSKEGETPGLTVRFDAEDHNGVELDAVEKRIPVRFAGIPESPHTEGSFVGKGSVTLTVPDSVITQASDGMVSVTVGSRMWPELGERLRFLLGYPHGCVEQTTSSTLPLLTARDLAPRIGMGFVPPADLTTKVQAGLTRLESMRTPSGGLAYWPGGTEPNPYGTAYAMRAIVLSRRAGIEPAEALVKGMSEYLREQMLSSHLPPEVRAAIAQSLAELGQLDPSAADPLFDTRSSQTVFGNASLALALATLPNQGDRVITLLDQVEGGFTPEGELQTAPNAADFHYYGSPTRTKAQAAMALRKLRPSSWVLPHLIRSLLGSTQSYTTQATAYSLMALSEEVRLVQSSAADARVFLDGQALTAEAELPSGQRLYNVPLSLLLKQSKTLSFESDSDKAMSFSVRATWQKLLASEAEGMRTPNGPNIYRVYTDAKGKPVDLNSVRAGDVLRVALVVKRPEKVPSERFGYIAVTDPLPAGFEPVNQDLATVSAQPELSDEHPFAVWFRFENDRPSHLELHDDRVNVYFDTASGDSVAASYLIRATTVGKFTIQPAAAELMYESGSLGMTRSSTVVIR